MSIKIDWSDVDNAATAFNIYRQETPILDSALPAPLAVVDKALRTYTDDTAVRNKLYYYRVGSVTTDITLTPNRALAYMPYSGPGPQTLLRGDWEFGYFGRIPVNAIFTTQEIKQFAGAFAGAWSEVVPTAPDVHYWFKFVVNGKILFVASNPFWVNLTFQSLYQAGLVYGTAPSSQWPAYVKTTLGEIPQNKVVVRGDDQFILKLPSSRANPLNTGTTNPDFIGGDFDQFMSNAYATRANPNPKGYKQVDDYGTFNSLYSLSSDFYGVSNLMLARGGAQNDAVSTIAINAGATTTGWKPVLELLL